MSDFNTLLERARHGDAAAVDALFAELYPALRRLAHARLSRGGRHGTLDTTALVHECYLKLAGASLDVRNHGHFMAYASRAMRSIIVDYARHRLREKRGGDAAHETLNTTLLDGLPGGDEQIVAVHEALEALAQRDARLAQVVEMRYFGGLSEQEIAASLGLTDRTVRRDWEKARLLLAAALRS